MISDEDFNAILNGPLSHPMPMFWINRLAISLRFVVDATGEAGEKALRAIAKEYGDRDNREPDQDDDFGTDADIY